jgi:hypothetical protein
MSPTNHMVRLTSVAALLVLANFASAYPYAVPQPTKTIEFRELNVQSWPLATAAPGSLDDILGRRALNTVCGYIGGDPDLPATCSAGSHCVVDAGQGVIGCCPDGGSCTQGIYTACVDSNSGAQNEVNPYVYTCEGSNVCYKNSFEGGYSQYGCGSASNLATTVAVSASGKSAVKLSTIPATQTDSETATATKKSTTSSNTRSSKTESKSKTESETTTKTTKTKSSTTETATSNTSESSTASGTDTETSSATQTGEESASSSTSASAPDSDGDDNGSKNTGAIIGGTISGVAALVGLVALGLFLWKRKKRNQGLDQNQYVHLNNPSAAMAMLINLHSPGDSINNIQPLLAPGMQEVRGTTPPPPSMPMPLPTARPTITQVIDRDDDGMEPYSSRTNPYGYGPSIGMAVSEGDQHPMDGDETPLTRETREREMDEYNQGYNAGLERIEEEDSRFVAAGSQSPYPGPRGGGGGPLWQQNRGPGWL